MKHAPALGPSDEFLFFALSGHVHVLAAGLRTYDDSAVAALMGRQRALCGAVGEPAAQTGVSTFDDGRLCARCCRIVPDDDRHRLFEHDQENP